MILALALGTLGLALLSLAVGAAGFGLDVDPLILWQVRAPRTTLAVLVGAALALSGAVLQGLLHNRLADPGLLGVTGGASFGAVLSFYWGLAAAFPPALPLGGLAGALVAAAAVLMIAARTGSGTALILAGIGVAAIASALVTMALSFAPNPYALAEVTIWLLGSLEDRSWREVMIALPPVAASAAMLLPLGARLDALALGEETAASLGIAVGQTMARAAFGTALGVGGAAAVAGGVGFVGLMVPNLLRGVVGERPGALLLPSALAGAALVLAADLVVRLIPLQQELRLGVLTALIGAPVLLAVAVREAHAA